MSHFGTENYTHILKSRSTKTVSLFLKVSRRADVVWLPQTCDLTPLNYYLWGAVKDKCYADSPETIDALKKNISEAIDEIQLHTIDNVLKKLNDRVGY